MSVRKTATTDEIKTSWKRLTRILHPDKCRECGAEEAFKKLTAAYEVLSDAEKRRRYDLQKDGASFEENVYYARANPFGQYAYYTTSFDDEAAESIRAFFAGEQPRFRMYTRAQHQHRQQYYQNHPPPHHHHFPRRNQQADIDVGGFSPLSILTLLLLFFGLLLPVLFKQSDPDPPFSFSSHADLTEQRFTRTMNVPYFVRKDFPLSGSALRSFENRIEASYVEMLQQNCKMETYGYVKAEGWCSQYKIARDAYYRTR